jgi:uncharacterized protein (DUF2236 family)
VRPLERLRDRITDSATASFKHAGYPLADTLAHRGDPGLFGPGSVSWRILGDASSFFGGVRALLVQAAHPEVVAGVMDHSRYREDPMGRLSRTSNYVTATTYGAMPEVEEAVAIVRRIHRRVRGTSHRGKAYSADVPDLAAWVHNALTDGFLAAYQAFGPRRLSPTEADAYVAEQTRVGRLLDADPMPETADGLADWLEGHAAVADSPGLREAIEFLRHPPLPWLLRIGYRVMFAAAAATIPARLRSVLGVRRYPGAITAGRLLANFLRWALGDSPTWKLALLRAGAPEPDGARFRQPLPIETLEAWGDRTDADRA